MSKIKVNRLENTSTANGGIDIDTSGHVQVDGLQMPTAGALGNRSLIINGGMTVAQRGISTSSDGYKTIDRFQTKSSGATGTISRLRSELIAGGPFDEGYRYFFRCFKAAACTVGSTSFFEVDYAIEAQDLVNSGWNFKNSSSYVTLSFWIKTNPGGKYGFSIETNDGTAYIYNKTFTLAANTWTKVVQKIPGNANLTVNNDNGLGATIKIFTHLGSTYNGGTDDSWANISTSDYGSIDSDWWTSTNSLFDLAGVQLEVGSKATAPQHEKYCETLQKCQRYFYKTNEEPVSNIYGTEDALYNAAWNYSGVNWAGFSHTLPTTMRTTPAVVLYSSSAAASSSSGVVGHYQVAIGWGVSAAQVAGQTTSSSVSISSASSGSRGSTGNCLILWNFTADADL